MIPFGCNASPWYPPASECPGRQGIHHGVDIDLPVGTPITSAVAGVARVNPPTAGRAYGRHVLIVRSQGRDILLGHMSRVTVADGDRVEPGQQLGLSGMSGVETQDGPHLHFEVRAAGGDVHSATDPWRLLMPRKATG